MNSADAEKINVLSHFNIERATKNVQMLLMCIKKTVYMYRVSLSLSFHYKIKCCWFSVWIYFETVQRWFFMFLRIIPYKVLRTRVVHVSDRVLNKLGQ